MSSVARAADAYREAIQAHREAKAALETALRDTFWQEGGATVAQLAEETGYSRQRIYQLLQEKKP